MLKLFDESNNIENSINKTIPNINFLYKLTTEEDNFILNLKKELFFEYQLLNLPNQIILSLFILLSSPFWLLGSLFKLKYNFDFVYNWFIQNVLFTKNIKEKNRTIIEKYRKEIDLYNKITNESILINSEIPFIEELDFYKVKQNFLDYTEKQIVNFTKLYQEEPEEFIKYYNSYALIKLEYKQTTNYIANVLNNEIRKQPQQQNTNNKKGIIIDSKDRFNKNID